METQKLCLHVQTGAYSLRALPKAIAIPVSLWAFLAKSASAAQVPFFKQSSAPDLQTRYKYL